VKLDSLKPSKGSIKNKKRIGRGHGSGLGKTSGRGHKGAGQRSGNKRRAWFEGGQMPLARRLPRRGFTNIFKEEIQIVNISDLNRIEKNSEIDPVVLQENGMIRSSLKPVKILGEGDIDKKLNVTASAFSASAKNKIEKAGGTATIL
jgi:large subunit ribosomal protein L15